jgi:hypothetical protein
MEIANRNAGRSPKMNRITRTILLAVFMLMASCCLGACGSLDDGPASMYPLTTGEQSITEILSPDRHPFCGAVGSRSEGWYWADNNELIAYANCRDRSDAACRLIGSRSEGWYSDDDLITWHNCHQAVGLALFGESCQGATGLQCYDLFGLYCCQASYEDPGAPAGVCASRGFCTQDQDCLAPGNSWPRPDCLGSARCVKHQCIWVCDPPIPHPDSK